MSILLELLIHSPISNKDLSLFYWMKLPEDEIESTKEIKVEMIVSVPATRSVGEFEL